MIALWTFLPLALEGEWGDWRAVAVVVISLIMLVGSIYMLLASNFGAYVGFLVLNVGFWGWMLMLSLIWLAGVPGTLPGTGPRTQEPHWVPFLAESEQGREFTDAINAFPQGWEPPGRIYPGNIDSRGQTETAATAVSAALARLGEVQGDANADQAKEWDFRLPGDPPPLDPAKAPPEGRVHYFQDDTPLLARFEIPATEKRRAAVVYAFRDKGATYLTSLYFLIASVLGLVLSTWLLARHERKEKERGVVEATT